MERFGTPPEDRVVFEVASDMELAALELIVRGYAGIVGSRSYSEGPDAAMEVSTAAENLAGRLSNTEKSIAQAGLMGYRDVDVTVVVHFLEERIGEITEEAITAFRLDPDAFMNYLSTDEMMEAQILFPPISA